MCEHCTRREFLGTGVASGLMLVGASWTHAWAGAVPGAEAKYSTRGPTETTPAYSQYFSWINNTNEGSTEKQTLANLEFFRWLHDEYGMVLDIYAWDAGNIDGPRYYGSMSTDKFKSQFPNGWGGIRDYAKEMGTRLGIWLGPDGFGDTPEEEKARHDLLVSFCKDYGMGLLKMDAVGSQLRESKQEALKNALIECRQHVPDLIVLNHRLKLGVAEPHATTFLWQGRETYIDVHTTNWMITAPHNRAGAMRRGVPPELKRLTEDCGVCISSCVDFWEDDLILQAFNRSLILAPQIYGNPWFLRDDEYPKLARIYNLHRRWRDIMVQGMVLPAEQYGPTAVSRGDGGTRLISLRNLTWEPVTHTVVLDESIGLTDRKTVELRQFHPSEKILGRFQYGDKVQVTILPFRACLLLATTQPVPEVGVQGCDYEVVRDVPGKPVRVKLLGLPGEVARVTLAPMDRTFTKATLAGRGASELLQGKPIEVAFSGRPLKQPWHRTLGDLRTTAVPADAEALYEATCFAGDNDALEYRSLHRSGPTKIGPVQAARDCFFDQQLLRERGCQDGFMFDGNEQTYFGGHGRRAIRDGALRIDFANRLEFKSLAIRGKASASLGPEDGSALTAQVSRSLADWQTVPCTRTDEGITLDLSGAGAVRYLRMPGLFTGITEVIGTSLSGRRMARENWRGSNLFAAYASAPAEKAWQCSFQLDEAAKGAYLCIAVNGRHGQELAYAALRVAGRPVGCPQRAPSYPGNVWEYPVSRAEGFSTYYVPVTEDLIRRPIDAVVLGLIGCNEQLTPEVWITAYPIPYESVELILE
jgi:hypothetical protein